MKLDKFAALGDPWIGGILEWNFILIWVTTWIVVTFVITDTGDQVIQEFRQLPSPILLWPISWVVFYLGFIVSAIYLTNCCRGSDREYLIRARLANLIYHLFRWPILFGLLTLDNRYAMIAALGFEWIITIFGIIVGLGIAIKNCTK